MKRKYRGYESPLECFRVKYKKRKISRAQLKREDSGLYRVLSRAEQIDDAIPEKKGQTYRSYSNPLDYFNDKYGDRKITREQLRREDSGLYYSLRYWGQFDKAIFERRIRDFNGNPLAYFRKKYAGRKMTRKKLSKKDSGLYWSLKNFKQLDEAIPEKNVRKYRRKYESPLDCFKVKYADRKGMTRTQLFRKDGSLYNSLRRRGQLDEAIPEKLIPDFSGNPLAYYKEHYGSRKMTRGQLSKEVGGLYHALIRAEQLDEAIPEKQEQRNFGGNPLAYFIEHFGDRKITRTQLQKEDGGLYHSLRRNKQLDEAIPAGISEKEKLEVMLRRMTE